MIPLSRILILSSPKDHVIEIVRLLKASGYKPTAIKDNGIEGLDLLTKESFELVICDFDLKFINGWLCIKEIKASAKIANVPLMLLSSKNLSLPSSQLEEYGIVKCLEFPISHSQFDFTLHSTLSLFRSSGTIESKYTIAKSALITEQAAQAVTLYSELNHLTKSSSRSSIGLAHAYEANDEMDKAEAVLTKAAQTGSATPSGLIMSMRIFFQRGDQKAAEQAAENLFNQSPGSFYFQQAVQILSQYESLNLLKKFCEKAISEKFMLGDFWLYFAKCLQADGNYDKALETLGQMEKLFGVNIELFSLRGSIHRQMKNYLLAMQSYEQGLRLSPRNAKVYFDLAVCNLDMDDSLTAEHYLESALKLNRDFRQAGELLAQIKKVS